MKAYDILQKLLKLNIPLTCKSGYVGITYEATIKAQHVERRSLHVRLYVYESGTGSLTIENRDGNVVTSYNCYNTADFPEALDFLSGWHEELTARDLDAGLLATATKTSEVA